MRYAIATYLSVYVTGFMSLTWYGWRAYALFVLTLVTTFAMMLQLRRAK